MMMLKNENNLIDVIKGKSINEIKDIFMDNKIKPENFNDFKETLLYLISQDVSFDIIKFIIEAQ